MISCNKTTRISNTVRTHALACKMQFGVVKSYTLIEFGQGLPVLIHIGVKRNTIKKERKKCFWGKSDIV